MVVCCHEGLDNDVSDVCDRVNNNKRSGNTHFPRRQLHSTHHHWHPMAHDNQALYLPFVQGATSLALTHALDGDVVAEVPLGHTLINGTSRDDMIATIGREPLSVVIINDRHEHEHQQLIELSSQPLVVAISPAQDVVAVMLPTGRLRNNAKQALNDMPGALQLLRKDDDTQRGHCIVPSERILVAG